MASIALGTLGGMAGEVIGGPIGALVGRTIGALAGSYIDQQIVNALTPPVQRSGPRLTTTDMQVSTEGLPVGRTYGRVRVQGNVFWSTRLLESINTDSAGSGKGGGSAATETTVYSYAANFAVGLCEGPVAGVGRIWADGQEVRVSKYEIRVHLGTEAQTADPLIEAKEGAAPAYRGLCYLVFEGLPLAKWGNRIPQISAEVFRPTGELEDLVQGVALIGGNEFGFDPELVRRTGGGAAQNRHTKVADTDVLASIDRLQMLCPNLNAVMLVLPWFGDDLRCGQCTIRPKVDTDDKTTDVPWIVSNLTRDTATLVSYIAGSASAGGSPNDASVIRLIQELDERNIKVTVCPFIMMDVAIGNTLPNPYSANAATNGQPAYPWRGRITCSPAAGYTGTVDKTATAATQVSTFMGTAAGGDFAIVDGEVAYSGPDEWSYRRFILHYAMLADLSGGVDTFLIGSEMIGLTQVRSSATAYPFVTALKTLAADVSGILDGSIEVGYTADWSEWNNHRPDDGSGDVLFNLDPLWSDANIDFLGIDSYMPLSDWRDGSAHLDFDPTGPCSIYDRDYLESNVRGGEYFDFKYANQAARDAQTRTAIADANPANEPWVFRQKDILNWWLNTHHDRPAGVRSGGTTGWVAQSKPVRFVEYGCSAADKGANQPNVFPDMKSSEGAYPYYSNRGRDDAMQRAFIGTLLDFYADPANNPTSTGYFAPMVDLSLSHCWAWDARPWPSFPLDESWGDHDNWHTGHWISGRLGAAPAEETITTVLEGGGFADYSVEPIPAVVDGVTVGGVVSARSLLEALRPAYQFDAAESDGVIKFISRIGRAAVATITIDDLVPEDPDKPAFRQTRGQETELPDVVKLRYGDLARDDQPAGTEARRSTGGSLRVVDYSPPVVMAEARAREIAEIELASAWVGRERAEFTLPPSLLALDAGDVVTFVPTARLMRVESIGLGVSRQTSAFAIDPMSYAPVAVLPSGGVSIPEVALLDPEAMIVDSAMLDDSDSDYAGYIAGVASPFGAGLAAWRSPTTSGFTLDTILPAPATLGVTTADFYSGPVWRWDRVNSFYLTLDYGALSSADELLVLGGANTLLVENADGEWEILQFGTATPNGDKSYILTDLLRGQRGSEHAMRDPVDAGARVLFVNGAVRQTGIGTDLIGASLNWTVGPADGDLSDPTFADLTVTLTAKGRRPLSPVHLAGERNSGTGDWAISWIRRSRLGGDSWEVAEVPLGEESEAYRLEILSGLGGAVLRTFLTSSASQDYTSAQQTTDFGSQQYSFYVRVYQLSASYGDGIPTTDLIWVH